MLQMRRTYGCRYTCRQSYNARQSGKAVCYTFKYTEGGCPTTRRNIVANAAGLS